jgi:hypothetical protein
MTPNKRVWKLHMSTQLRETWHTDSLDMVVLPTTGASRYNKCYINGGTSPEYLWYHLVDLKYFHFPSVFETWACFDDIRFAILGSTTQIPVAGSFCAGNSSIFVYLAPVFGVTSVNSGWNLNFFYNCYPLWIVLNQKTKNSTQHTSCKVKIIQTTLVLRVWYILVKKINHNAEAAMRLS